MTPQERQRAIDLLWRHGITMKGADGPAGGRRQEPAPRMAPPPAPAVGLDDPRAWLYNLGIE